jgi:signal transduction histidine kinase
MSAIASIARRVTAFALAIVVIAVLIGWAAHVTWRQVEDLNFRLTEVQIHSFQTAAQFRAHLREVDYTLLRFEMNHDPADWESFLRLSKTLDAWIDEQRPRLNTVQEAYIFDQINQAYDDYMAAGKKLGKPDPQGGADSGLSRFAAVERESVRLRELQDQLLSAHRYSLSKFLEASRKSLSLLRSLTFGALFLLLVLGIWLASIVYREMIAPLHRKLVETSAILERQEKLASLGVLAAGVAHEIRNPLTAVKARLFTLQKALSPGSAELEDSIVIGGEINRLERIVKDFLQFARPTEPHFEELTPDSPFREVYDLLSPQLEKRHIKLVIDGVSPAHFRADPQQLKQVLINLVQNSADSIGAHGLITLRARTDNAQLADQFREVVILEVLDTGRGIPPMVQKRLFDPFFTTKDSGTGLGLAIAARIVEKHGGTLDFQTAINQGTTFGVVLPLTHSP